MHEPHRIIVQNEEAATPEILGAIQDALARWLGVREAGSLQLTYPEPGRVELITDRVLLNVVYVATDSAEQDVLQVFWKNPWEAGETCYKCPLVKVGPDLKAQLSPEVANGFSDEKSATTPMSFSRVGRERLRDAIQMFKLDPAVYQLRRISQRVYDIRSSSIRAVVKLVGSKNSRYVRIQELEFLPASQNIPSKS